MKRLPLVWTMLLSLIPFAPSGAETPSDTASMTLDEVVVTATKTEEARGDVPNAVLVVDEVDIEESPARTVGELLGNELGIDLRTYGDFGGAAEELQIRGMASNATQVRVNGVTLNSPSLGTANLNAFPLNAVERIEVVKGAGSLLYGSGAMGGTVDIVTKRPRREAPALKAEAGIGTQGSAVFQVEQGMFLTDALGYYLTARALKTDGFRSNSDLTHEDVTLNLVLDRGKPLTVSLYGDFVNRDYGQPGVKPPAGTGTYVLNGQEFFNSESASLLDRGRDHDGHVILNVESKPTPWLEVLVRGDYSNLENYFYYRSAFDGSGQRTWVTNKVYGAEGDLTFKPLEGGSLLLGTEYKAFNWENKIRLLDPYGTDIPDSQTTAEADLHSLGTYIEAQYRPCIYVKGLAGVRHEKNSQFGSEDLPRFGLIFNPLPETALKLNTGKHFLAPTPNDLYWPEDPYQKGNPNLAPETGWHTDATLEQALLKDKVFLTLGYFNWNVTNKILWAPDENWVYTPQNLEKYKGDGVEAGAKIGRFFDLSLTLSYTYTNAKEETQYVTRPAPYTPEHLFKGQLVYAPAGTGFRATLIERYVGERPYFGSDDTATTPAYVLDPYWTTDIRLEQRLFGRWLLTLDATNLFNTSYETFLGYFMDPDTWKTSITGFPGAGRAILFRVAYEF